VKTFLAGIYFLLWWFWNFLYEHRFLVPKRVNAVVVSVGNLTVGGTGKTPLTIFLGKFYQERGYRVGIVSRGYKGSYRGAVALVSDGTTLFGSAAISGDEPMMMARQLTSVPIAVSKDRYQGCQLLIEKFKVNLILLDDGFQHRRLHRDLNLLLIDTTEKNFSMFPKGPLREKVSAALRANVVILTRQGNSANERGCMGAYPWTGPTLKTYFSPIALIHLQTGVSKSPSDLKGEKVLAFCGIGNPQSFLKMLTDLGADVCESVVFQDHYNYTAWDIKELEKKSKNLSLKRIVTTEKDAIKIESLAVSGIDIFVLQIEIRFIETTTVWERHLVLKNET
jgi:tetraacyldisaccharide 4'-kinase